MDARGEAAAGPRVTINKKKVLLMNMRAYEALGMPAAVELRFDEENRTIGMAPVDPRKEHAFPIKSRGKGRERAAASTGTYRIINAAAFCKHFSIQPAGTMLFNKIDFENDGTMLLELNTATNVGRGSR